MPQPDHTPEFKFIDGASNYFGSLRAHWEPVHTERQELRTALAQIPVFSHVMQESEFPNVSVYKIPEGMNLLKSALSNRAAEVELTPEILGNLAFKRWSSLNSSEVSEVIGGIILKAIARSEEQLWELPLLLTEDPLGGSTAPIVEAYLSVSSPLENDFSQGKLSLLFTYHSSDDPLSSTIISHWVEQVARYTTLRGLPESLMALCGDNRTLEELIDAEPLTFPLPPNFNHVEHIESLLPETLSIGNMIHGRHRQVTCGQHTTDLRIPTTIESAEALRHILDNTRAAQTLREAGFSVSLCEGISPLFQGSREDSDEAVSIADLLPTPEELEALRDGLHPKDPNGYWGPYLHFRSEHEHTPEARMQALSGMMLLVYNFRDHISGLRPLEEALPTTTDYFLSLTAPGGMSNAKLIACVERLSLHLNDSPITNEAHQEILQLAAYLESTENLLLGDRLLLLAGVNNALQLPLSEAREVCCQLRDVIDEGFSLQDFVRASLSYPATQERYQHVNQYSLPPQRSAASALYESIAELARENVFGHFERGEHVSNVLYHKLRHLSLGQIEFLQECLTALRDNVYAGEEIRGPLLNFLDSVDGSLREE